MYIHKYTYIQAYKYMCIPKSMHSKRSKCHTNMSSWTHDGMSPCLYIHINIYTYIYIYHALLNIHTYTYIYTCIYTGTQVHVYPEEHACKKDKVPYKCVILYARQYLEELSDPWGPFQLASGSATYCNVLQLVLQHVRYIATHCLSRK